MRPRANILATLVVLVPYCVGCSETATEDDTVAEATQSLTSVCADAAGVYFIDGIPSYAQCTASTNAAIYSNNGVDTATSAIASDWKRTQFSGGYQCTELVHRYWLFKWNVNWIPDGDAYKWCDATPPASSGIVMSTTAIHGDAIVFAKGSCGVSTTYGHVAVVDAVDSAGSKVTIVEQNNPGRHSVALSCAKCFLHVVANMGAAGTSGSGGATNTTSTTGGALAAGGLSATGGSASTTGGRLPQEAVRTRRAERLPSEAVRTRRAERLPSEAVRTRRAERLPSEAVRTRRAE